jgi:hypothetical protein
MKSNCIGFISKAQDQTSCLWEVVAVWWAWGESQEMKMRSRSLNSTLDSSADHSSRSMDSLFPPVDAKQPQDQEDQQWPVPDTAAGGQGTIGADYKDDDFVSTISADETTVSMIECLCCGFSLLDPCGLLFQFAADSGKEPKRRLSFSMLPPTPFQSFFLL